MSGWIFRGRMPGRNAQQWVADRVLSSSSAARKSCRSNSTSDGVSIRGVFEVASFRPGKAVEAEPEALPPPLFKLCAMFRSQCPYLGLIRSQLCRIRLCGRYRGSQNRPTLPVNVTGQIGQRSTLTHEVIDEVVRLATFYRSVGERLIGQPCEAVGSGVPDGIQLHDPIMDG